MADLRPIEESPAPAPSPGRSAGLLAGVLAVAAAAIVALALVSTTLAPRTRPLPEDAAPSGTEPAPAFTLRSLRGSEQISLADFRGKVVVLNFFASWCGPCELEAADLQRTWSEYQPGQGIVFLGVAIQDEYSAARRFLDKHGISYPAVFDANGAVMVAYRVTGIPTTIVVDARGRIASRHAGIFVGEQGRARLHARIEAARRARP